MNVFLGPPSTHSPSIARVSDALAKYAPSWVHVVPNRDEADHVVLHVIGRLEHLTREAEKIRRRGQSYSMMQYVLKSTQRPSAADWYPLWHDAVCVWSYYDLPKLYREDTGHAPYLPNFFHSPLGADGTVFTLKPARKVRSYSVATSGQSWLTESVREVVIAAQAVQAKPVFHLGPELHRPGALCRTGMSDNELAGMFRQCDFVSGLRRIEGFELVCAEGLLCGARPVLFEREHYSSWYNGWAVFVPEEPREAVVESLKAIFRGGVTPVTRAERNRAATLFNWATLVPAFWERVSSYAY